MDLIFISLALTSCCSTMETYNFEAFPSPYNAVHIALFHEVENAREIKSRLVRAATTDGPEGDQLKQEVDFAFLEARMASVAPNKPSMY